jgi:hypothetical protein
MRVGRLLAGISLCTVGLAVGLLALGVSARSLAEAATWSPVLLLVAGLWLLLEAATPRSVTAAAVTLLLAGGLGLLASRHIVGRDFWEIVLAGLIVLAGALLARSGARAAGQGTSHGHAGSPVRRRSTVRSRVLDPIPEGTMAVAVTACFADVSLALPIDVSEVEATAVMGHITLRAPELRPADIVVHRAFVLSRSGLATAAPRSRTEMDPSKLTVVVVSVGGDVEVRSGPGDQDPGVPRSLSEDGASGADAAGPT